VAIKIKPIGDIAKKWVEVTPGRSVYYEAAASVAGTDWEKGATAAAASYKAAITAPNIDKMFTGGIRRAGAAKYERKVKDVGVARFGPGITAALPDYTAGFEPFASTIAAITLPARAPRGSVANYERVKVIGTELNKKRLALRTAGV
jgi:hypothetical protein